jgi:hypothetical protein
MPRVRDEPAPATIHLFYDIGSLQVDTTQNNSSSGIQGKFSLKLPYVDSRRSERCFMLLVLLWPVVL